jgi:hypothetical protein
MNSIINRSNRPFLVLAGVGLLSGVLSISTTFIPRMVSGAVGHLLPDTSVWKLGHWVRLLPPDHPPTVRLLVEGLIGIGYFGVIYGLCVAVPLTVGRSNKIPKIFMIIILGIVTLIVMNCYIIQYLSINTYYDTKNHEYQLYSDSVQHIRRIVAPAVAGLVGSSLFGAGVLAALGRGRPSAALGRVVAAGTAAGVASGLLEEASRLLPLWPWLGWLFFIISWQTCTAIPLGALLVPDTKPPKAPDELA